MFSRQRAILRLIHDEGGCASRLRLVKLAFVLSQEVGAPRTGTYDFVPYKRGPFSFTLYHEMQALERDGWLKEARNEIRLAEAPDFEIAFLDRDFLKRIDDVSRRYRSMTTPAIIKSVYANYPWFTLNSDVPHRRTVSRPNVKPAVYTVGYEGLTVDALLDLLLRRGIRQLIDVRSNPVARRYGFHKTTLSRLCKDVGIEYVHFVSLGIPSALREGISDQSSYERLFERYTKEILPSQRKAIDSVTKLMLEKPSALMCMEADHHYCHRSRLGAAISRETSLPVRELREL